MGGSAIRSRIHGVVKEKYAGITDHSSLIREKAQKGAVQVRANTLEYKAWVRKVKAEHGSTFKLPADAYKGKPTADEHIREYVRKGKAKEAEQQEKYHAFLRDVNQKHQEKMKEKAKEVAEACGSFADVQAAMERERAAKLKANLKDWDDEADKYWSWLQSTKNHVQNARRPGSAPSVRSSGVESAHTIVQRRREELAKDMQ